MLRVAATTATANDTGFSRLAIVDTSRRSIFELIIATLAT